MLTTTRSPPESADEVVRVFDFQTRNRNMSLEVTVLIAAERRQHVAAGVSPRIRINLNMDSREAATAIKGTFTDLIAVAASRLRSHLASGIHGLTPTATCCRRSAARKRQLNKLLTYG